MPHSLMYLLIQFHRNFICRGRKLLRRWSFIRLVRWGGWSSYLIFRKGLISMIGGVLALGSRESRSFSGRLIIRISSSSMSIKDYKHHHEAILQGTFKIIEMLNNSLNQFFIFIHTLIILNNTLIIFLHLIRLINKYW